ncbi:FMN reductase [Microbispora sp. RL4-1S]|uniref:FMN reductase n=1 Tax=Microbispora oryzae TaxID=2806554 RepID=A0A941AQS5_9ACTN|nr:FMN reductase [Microbispora oryzae]MBP2705104.1 FMN reductase [Microbispora oryzae]
MTALRLVAVSAGLSQPSSTRLLADRLVEATRRHLPPEREVETLVIELRGLAVDIANNLVTGFPSPGLSAAIDAVTGADGLVAVTPIFTASYSGLFKSFFDVIDATALTGTPVVVAATGGTARHSLALEHALRPMFAYLRAIVAPTAVYAASEDWGGGRDVRADGYTEGLAGRIDRAGAELAALMPSAAEQPAAAGTAGTASTDEVVPFEQQLAALRP